MNDSNAEAAGMQLKDLRARAKEAGVKGLSKRRLYTKHNKGELLHNKGEATLKAEEANETRRVARLEKNIANAEVVFYGSVADSFNEPVVKENKACEFLGISIAVTGLFGAVALCFLNEFKYQRSPNIKNELKYSNGF